MLGARIRPGVDLAERPAAPLVGRGRELEALRLAYRQALAGHTVRLVTVLGEPGVGKSRLVRELAAFVDAQPELVAWRRGRCPAYGEAVGFWALGEILKEQAGILESDDPRAGAAKLDAAVRAVAADPAEREWLKARLAPLVGLATAAEASGGRAESFMAWRRFLELVAAHGPLVLVVEDLHWAEVALLDFLEELVDRAGATDLLLVVTARPELLERRPGWGAGPAGATVALAPLDDRQTAQLLASLLDRSVLPAEVQALLLERAGGNPLYAEEFVRLLVDRGLLTRHGGLAGAAELPLPDTFQALIAARLDTLAPEHKRLLQDAAVVGKVFWSGALAAMGATGQEEVRAGLRQLERAELIAYHFTQALAHARAAREPALAELEASARAGPWTGCRRCCGTRGRPAGPARPWSAPSPCWRAPGRARSCARPMPSWPWTG